MQYRWMSKMLGGLLVILVLAGCSPSSLTLTYKEGQCTLDGPKKIPNESFTFKLVLEEDQYPEYGFMLITLAEGKTLEDLRSQPQNTGKPDWVNNIISDDHGIPGTYTYTIDLNQNATYKGEPIYILCGFRKEGDAEATMFAQLGPFEVKK